MHSKVTYSTSHTLITNLHGDKYWMLTYDVYGAVLVWKHPNTISTHNSGSIEVWSGIDCCSWYNLRSCHHLCDSELKGCVRYYTILVTRKKRLKDPKWWNVPQMSGRRNCTCEGHNLSRTWSLHTGLQLSSWNWKWTMLLLGKKIPYTRVNRHNSLRSAYCY